MPEMPETLTAMPIKLVSDVQLRAWVEAGVLPEREYVLEMQRRAALLRRRPRTEIRNA